jgi:hypothetical protein
MLLENWNRLQCRTFWWFLCSKCPPKRNCCTAKFTISPNAFIIPGVTLRLQGVMFVQFPHHSIKSASRSGSSTPF